MRYAIKHDAFEGPLDLLVGLIERHEFSINEISLAKVTDDFLAYLKTLEGDRRADRETLAEFLVVAAELLLIKSRSLLPEFQVSPEEEASIQELERRLADYQQMKHAASSIGGLARGGLKSFVREAYAGAEVVFYPPAQIKPDTLAATFRRILAAIPKAAKLVEEKIRRVISLEEKIRHLERLLTERVERAFSEVVLGAKGKVEIIVSFLALLELAKQRFISVEQGSLFGDIKFRRATPQS